MHFLNCLAQVTVCVVFLFNSGKTFLIENSKTFAIIKHGVESDTSPHSNKLKQDEAVTHGIETDMFWESFEKLFSASI